MHFHKRSCFTGFILQSRQYSDGRKGFLQSIYDNMKEGFAKDKTLNVSICTHISSLFPANFQSILCVLLQRPTNRYLMAMS